MKITVLPNETPTQFVERYKNVVMTDDENNNYHKEKRYHIVVKAIDDEKDATNILHKTLTVKSDGSLTYVTELYFFVGNRLRILSGSGHEDVAYALATLRDIHNT